MRVDVVTIFPAYFDVLDLALIGKARERGLVDVRVHDLRVWTSDVHRTVDDAPYGGGPGMLMKPEPWFAALAAVTGSETGQRPRVLLPTPAGRLLTQELAAELATEPWLVVACGRYEGIDARVSDAWAADEISIGDYVVNGGEVAALVILEAVTRLLPGMVGNAESVADDSHTTGLLEGPAYTRPPEIEGRRVPDVLLSGDHSAVARWRRDEALRRTARLRPDLLARAELSERDRQALPQSLPPSLPEPLVEPGPDVAQ
jgi:tRNA (guanine37-N1)-methyltransferase